MEALMCTRTWLQANGKYFCLCFYCHG
ncbi:hypothetical protein LINGRAHAP2_LOCUS7675 [Linum grandiflorum]